jgi:transposase
MVFRKISQDIKDRVIFLLENDWIPYDVADIFGVSTRSISRWRRNVEIHGSTVPPPNPLRGRPRILNPDMTHDLSILISESPAMFLDEIQDWLALVHDVNISRTALHENIRDCGITYKMIHKAALERDDEARHEWHEHMRNNWVASQCVVVDETSKDDRTLARLYGRAPSGQDAVMSAHFVRGERYSMVAAMGIEGYLATRVVEGSVDGDEFFDFIVNEVVCFETVLMASLLIQLAIELRGGLLPAAVACAIVCAAFRLVPRVVEMGGVTTSTSSEGGEAGRVMGLMAPEMCATRWPKIKWRVRRVTECVSYVNA